MPAGVDPDGNYVDGRVQPGGRQVRVRQESLPARSCRVRNPEAVAHDLTMSARTLQRRLRAEGTTFQSVLESTRESLARHYLAESELSAGEISFLLGYADPRSFYRAVQAWTGLTPQLVRAAPG